MIEKAGYAGGSAEHGVDLGPGLQFLLCLDEGFFNLVVSDSKVGVAEPVVILSVLDLVSFSLDRPIDLIVLSASNLRQKVPMVVVR